jgi:hypothetical protein
MADGVTAEDKEAMKAAIAQAKKAGLLAPDTEELTYKLAPMEAGQKVPVSVEHITPTQAVVKVSRGYGVDAKAIVDEKGALKSDITLEPIVSMKGFSPENQKRIIEAAQTQVAFNKGLYESTPDADTIHDLAVAKTNPARALLEQEAKIMHAMMRETALAATKGTIKITEVKNGDVVASGLNIAVPSAASAAKAKE